MYISISNPMEDKLNLMDASAVASYVNERPNKSFGTVSDMSNLNSNDMQLSDTKGENDTILE